MLIIYGVVFLLVCPKIDRVPDPDTISDLMTFRVINMVQREQIQAFWQSPIDHHTNYWTNLGLGWV